METYYVTQGTLTPVCEEVWGGGEWEGGGICIPMANSCWYMV